MLPIARALLGRFSALRASSTTPAEAFGRRYASHASVDVEAVVIGAGAFVCWWCCVPPPARRRCRRRRSLLINKNTPHTPTAHYRRRRPCVRARARARRRRHAAARAWSGVWHGDEQPPLRGHPRRPLLCARQVVFLFLCVVCCCCWFLPHCSVHTRTHPHKTKPLHETHETA